MRRAGVVGVFGLRVLMAMDLTAVLVVIVIVVVVAMFVLVRVLRAVEMFVNV